MAKFPSLTFTEQGLQMLVQAQNSHKLTVTSGKLGSGVLADSDNISKFTDLKAPKMTLPITKVDDSNPEKIVLTFDTSNTALEQGFVSREIGIFAKLDDGAETLYAYSNAGNDYDYIPSKDTPTDENRLVVNLVVSSSANISVEVDGSIVYAHMSDVKELIAGHNTSESAHQNLLQVTSTANKPASMAEKGLWVEITG
ncbi:MAG: phage tail protein [Dialister sp.]|nr:phage tail protein [Dialister sp.]MDY5544960.1 phage tail protein [Dialister sp.]